MTDRGRRRIALVTGASRGIGAAIARRLAADGCDVVVHYGRSEEQAAAVAESCARVSGGRALALRADVREAASLERLKETLEREKLPPDIVVHNAGIAYAGLIDDTDEAVWDEMMTVHLKAAYRLARLFSPAMRWRREGRFVHVSSLWGQIGASGEAAYSAAKGGLNSFTKALARELAPAGITVNAVAPGAIDTEMLLAYTAEERAALVRDIPLGRLGTPAEVAELVAFLASDRAGYITGQVIGLTGGWHR